MKGEIGPMTTVPDAAHGSRDLARLAVGADRLRARADRPAALPEHAARLLGRPRASWPSWAARSAIADPRELDYRRLRGYAAALAGRGSGAIQRRSQARRRPRALRLSDPIGVSRPEPGGAAAEPEVAPRACPGSSTAIRPGMLLERIPAATPLEARDRAMLELAYSAGLRCAELVGLDLDSIDFDSETRPRPRQGRQGADRAARRAGAARRRRATWSASARRSSTTGASGRC